MNPSEVKTKEEIILKRFGNDFIEYRPTTVHQIMDAMTEWESQQVTAALAEQKEYIEQMKFGIARRAFDGYIKALSEELFELRKMVTLKDHYVPFYEIKQKHARESLSIALEPMNNYIDNRVSERNKLIEEIRSSVLAEQKGLRWVKASERLPDELNPILFRHKRPTDEKFDFYIFGWLHELLQYSNRSDVEWLSDESTPSTKEGENWTDKDMQAAHEQGWLIGRDEHTQGMPTLTASAWLSKYEKSHERYAIQLSNDRKAAIEKEREKEAFAAGFAEWVTANFIKGMRGKLWINTSGNRFESTSDLITLYKSTLEKEGKKI